MDEGKIMTLGKIKYTNTYGTDEDGDRVFTGMDIAAEFLNAENKPAAVSFRYKYWTLDLRGQVERVLSRYLAKTEYPEDIYNVMVD